MTRIDSDRADARGPVYRGRETLGAQTREAPVQLYRLVNTKDSLLLVPSPAGTLQLTIHNTAQGNTYQFVRVREDPTLGVDSPPEDF